MREAAADVAAMTKFIELWCPIYTPLWPHEVGHLVDLSQVERAKAIGLRIFSECLDDPSVKGSRINFWDMFHLCVLAKLGESTVMRMIEDDTLTSWLDQIEALLQEHSAGDLSMQIADYVTQDEFYDPALLEKEDWDCLSTMLKFACDLMAAHDAVPWSGVAGADRHRDVRRGPA